MKVAVMGSKSNVLHRARRASSGFGLVESLLVIAMLGIVLTMALPSFAALMARMRVDSALTAFSQSMHFARGEAVSRNRSILICRSTWNAASTDAPTCSTTGEISPKKNYAAHDWAAGWVVYQPSTSSGLALTGVDQVLLRVQAPHWAVSLVMPSATGVLRYTPMGVLMGDTTELTLTASHDAFPSSHTVRRCIAKSGRVYALPMGGCL